MRTLRMILFSILLLASPVILAKSSTQATSIGTAYDQASRKLLYLEHYYCEEDGLRCAVEYRKPDGEIFARKTLDYTGSLIGPSLKMSDFRFDTDFSIAATPRKNLVVDAGFDNYVRSVWELLESGEELHFSFLLIGLDNPLKMRANLNESEDCDSGELCLAIRLDSWLLSRLISPVELRYSKSQRTLLRFSGVSNIKGEGGESLDVDIYYQHRP